MTIEIDEIDRLILKRLQVDAGQSFDELAEGVNLSRNACWRRVRRMEDAGLIQQRVALLDAEALGLGLQAIVLIKTSRHSADWLEQFRAAISLMPEITAAHRMSGDLDYILRVRLRDMKAYDQFYQRLISKLHLDDISASFVMEDLKDSTALPL